jgi:hypothetical protein
LRRRIGDGRHHAEPTIMATVLEPWAIFNTLAIAKPSRR